MEDIIEYLARGLFVCIRLVVVLIWSAIELAYEKVFWWIGWPILRALTLGKFPKEGFMQDDHATPRIHFFVSLAGVTLPIVALYILAVNLGALGFEINTAPK